MAAPPQGMGGPSDEDRRRDTRHHNEVVRLGRISIIAAIIIGGSTVFLGFQTGFVLDEIKSIEQKNLEIENFPPIFDIEGNYIQFLGNGYPKYEYNNGITVTAVTNHYLKFTVTDVTIKYLNSNFAPCYFVSEPDIKLWRPSSIVLSPNGESKQLEPEITIDFIAFGKFHNTRYDKDEGVLHDLGSVIFDIQVEDIQDNTKKYLLQPHASLVVRIPNNLSDSIQNCEKLPEDN